jgi:Beta-propeller repeat/IPT/TIG domain
MSRLGVAFPLLSLLAFSSVEARDPGLDSVPISFEQNRGQAPGEILFSARGKSGLLGLTRAAIIFPAGGPRLRFRGAAAAVVKGRDARPGRVNYFLGNDPSKWRTNVPTFGAVEYGRLYPGIDMVVHGHGGELQYDFLVGPHADPMRIALAIDGARGSAPLRIDDEGDLIIPIASGEARVRRPHAYQEIDGERVRVEAAYEIRDRREVRFRLGSYDRKQPLIIDPVLSYSTYLGGTSDEEENAIAVDSSGNIYIAGNTKSSDFPVTSGVAQPAFGGRGSYGGDAYVIKYDPKGNRIVYATYLGGSGDDNARGIAVDGSGRAYVTGDTDSKNFPLSQPFQGTFGGSIYDSFITRLSVDGNALSYSSYLGGSGNDLPAAVAVDSSGNAYIAGRTFSTNFPNTNGFQTSFAGRLFDGFLTKINAAGSAVVYSTYLGGNTYDFATAVALDASNNAYVTGFTFSSNFPTKAAVQGTLAAGNCTTPGSSSSNCADAFVAKIDTTASGSASLIYSTFLGGGNNDYGNAIAVDSTGAVYIAGNTESTNFPTVSPLQAANAGDYDAFVAKLNASGSALVYSTYLGGQRYDEITALRVDGSGRAFVFGSTASQDFPLKSAFQAAHGGGSDALIDKTVAAPPGGSTFALITFASDAFVARIEASGSTLGYSSYLGGSGDDLAYGLALEGPNVWVSGQTNSTNFRTVSPVQAALKGGSDLFFSRIAGFGISSISPTFGPTSGGTRVTVAGEGLLPGATLTIGGVAATGLSVTSTSVSGTTGAHAAGAVNVGVGNPDGEQSTLAAGFFYTDDPLPSLSLTPSSLTIESGSSGSISATLTAAQTSDLSVALSVSSSQFVQVQGSVTIPAGSTTATFNALGLAVGGPVTITGKLPQALGGQTSSVSVTVTAALHPPRRRASRH